MNINSNFQVDVFGADAGPEETDVFFDNCLQVVRHIYTRLQLHGKYVCCFTAFHIKLLVTGKSFHFKTSVTEC